MNTLFRNLIRFGRLLHDAGLDVHAGRMIDVASALDHIDIGRRSDFYFGLRTLLVHRERDLPLFDTAFRAFWREHPDTSLGIRAAGRQRTLGPAPVVLTGSPVGSSAEAGESETSDTFTASIDPSSYSARETIRVKDFAEFTESEIKQARALVAALTWSLGVRRTRRRAPDFGREPDLRRLVRRNIRYGAEPMIVPTRHRVVKPRSIVIIADVSGSMERYARMLLHFVYSLARSRRRVEAFVFATRFTRITRELAKRGVDAAVAIPSQVPDWGGGTRIGEALRTFNVRWARRVLTHGPLVLLISDGWDRGDPDVLSTEMARLQRSCRRLIWLNPLLGAPDYQPLTRGMQAALPFVDDFLPAHNIDSLEALASHLNRITDRPAR